MQGGGAAGAGARVVTLRLRLVAFGLEQVAGIYRVRGQAGRMPDRCRFLHPDAAASFVGIADQVVVSDMFRTPESSLAAVRAGRGAQMPGYSAHNYGLAVDLDISATLARWQFKSKRELDEAMEGHGWFCHRRDHKLDFEAWHYNFLGRGTVIAAKYKNTSGWVEGRITQLYGDQLKPDDLEAQGALQKLGFYGGALDGGVGPLTREATRAFQRAWGLPRAHGELDNRTRRTLAYVAGWKDRELVPMPAPARAA